MDETIWSLTSPRVKRISGSKNFHSSPQKDFCNNIGTLPTWRDVRLGSVVRIQADIRQRPSGPGQAQSERRISSRPFVPRITIANISHGPARHGEFLERDQCDSTRPAQSPKLIAFPPDPNQIHNSRHPVPREGRWPSSRTLGRDAVDAAASGAQADRRAGLGL